MEDILREFSEQTAAVMELLLKSEMDEQTIRRVEDGYLIECRCEIAFEYDVLLRGGAGMPEEDRRWSFGPGKLRREGDGYALTATLELVVEERWEDVTLIFDRAETRVRAIRANQDLLYHDPWMHLSSTAFGIVRKAQCFPRLLNDRERELLPLLRELAALKHWGDNEKYTFPILKKRFPPELVPMLEALERAEKWEKLSRCSDRLDKALRLGKYVPLWEEIRLEILSSQINCPDRDMVNTQFAEEITATLRDHGYEGSYPDYRKRGSVAKTRWIPSRGRYHLVRRGTPICSYIRFHCDQGGEGTYFAIACGAELLKDDEPTSLERCRFDGDGKHFLDHVNHYSESGDDGLVKLVELAVKKAELLPLTRAEKKLDGQISFFTMFTWIFLLGGGFFAVCMTLGLAALSLVLGIIADGFSGLGEFMASLPWLQTFAGSWGLSGGTLGILFGFYNRK